MLLGYTVDTRENTLRPPDISLATDITVQHRATLIRAFLELSIIVTHSQGAVFVALYNAR
jgi:arabinogalactan endo-1,4-beta-galactosidase